MSDSPSVRLPPIFEVSDGRDRWEPPIGLAAGLLLRDTSLPALLHHVGANYPVAVDIDSIEGLAEDEAACEFLVGRLGFRIVLAHRVATAACIAAMGGLALLRVFAVDGTGLRRSLETSPRLEQIGSAVSPGIVLPHLAVNELAMLPRPILAYGLIDRPSDVSACLQRADSIALSRAAMARILHPGPSSANHEGGRDGASNLRPPRAAGTLGSGT